MQKTVRYCFIFVLILCFFISSDDPFSFAENLPDIQNLTILDLETAQKIALEKNPSIASARERVVQAKERISQAKSAYWPRIDGSWAMSRIELSKTAEQNPFLNSDRSTFSTDSPQDYYNADLIASWTLFDGFERKFNLSAAKFQHKETMAAQQDAHRLLLSAVSQAYFTALFARENIRIAESDQTFNQKQLKDAQARQRIGTGPLSDVLNFQVQINTARSRLITAQESYQIALHILAALLGQRDDFFNSRIKLSDLSRETPEDLISPDPESLFTAAEIHRPDLFKAEYGIYRSEQQIGTAKANFYPTVQLSGNLNGEKTDNARLSKDDFGNVVALSVHYNFFSGGFHRARLNEAISVKKEAENNFADILINIRADVREALTKLDSARELLELQRSNADLVKQNRDLVEKEYAAGQTSLVRLNEAQRDLINAQSRLVLALVSLKQAWQDVKTSTGEILIPFSKL